PLNFLALVSAPIIELFRTLDLGVADDAVATDPAELLQIREAAALHEFGHPGNETFDHIGSDRLNEHRRGADLRSAAAEEEVAEGVIEVGDAADARKRFVRKGLRHLRHLRQREGED